MNTESMLKIDLVTFPVVTYSTTSLTEWRHLSTCVRQSLDSDVDEYVTTEKVTRIYFQHTSRIHTPVEIQTHWVYTGWLFLVLKLSSWKKEWTSLTAFINWEFLTGCLLAIINRTRAFLEFKMAARLSRLLYLKSELLSWPLHSVKRKPLLVQLSNCHNNRGKNVHSVLPCLREMNRINRQFVYISIDTAYNSFPYMTAFFKRWFMTIFNANINKYVSCSVKVGMKLLNTETPVTRNIIPQILLNVQDFYFYKVGYTTYDEGILGP
jgi:hypothetical protein